MSGPCSDPRLRGLRPDGQFTRRGVLRWLGGMGAALVGASALTGCDLLQAGSTGRAEPIPDPDLDACRALAERLRGALTSVSELAAQGADVGLLPAVYAAHLRLIDAVAVPAPVSSQSATPTPSSATATSPSKPGPAAAVGALCRESADWCETTALTVTRPPIVRMCVSLAAAYAQQEQLLGSTPLPTERLLHTDAALTGAEVAALQTVLSLEYAAVYVLAALGGRVSRSSDAKGFAAVDLAWRTRRSRRDQLIDLLRSNRVTPTPAAAAYPLPSALLDGGPTGAALTSAATQAVLAEVMQSGLAAYAFLASATEEELRAAAGSVLRDDAVDFVRYGGTASDFPGAEELVTAAPAPVDDGETSPTSNGPLPR